MQKSNMRLCQAEQIGDASCSAEMHEAATKARILNIQFPQRCDQLDSLDNTEITHLNGQSGVLLFDTVPCRPTI